MRNVFQLADYLPDIPEVCASSVSNSIGVAIHTCNSSSGTLEVEAGDDKVKVTLGDKPKLPETVSKLKNKIKFFQKNNLSPRNNGHLKTFMNFKLKHYLHMRMSSFIVYHGTRVETRSQFANLGSFLPGLKLRLSDVVEIAFMH